MKQRLLALLLAFLMLVTSGLAACGKTDASKKVKVSFDLQGGTGTAAPKTVTVGEKYGELPAVTKTANTFAGWYLNAAGAGNVITEDITVKEEKDHTLYAKWTPTEGAVKVSVSRGLRDVDGQNLATPFHTTVTLGPR